MFFGAFKFKDSDEPQPDFMEKKPAEEIKSSSPETFLKTPEAREFVRKWSAKMKDGKPMYTKRGVLSLLRSIFQIPGLSSDKEVLDESNELLSLLGGMDGLQGFLAGWKAKSEGIIKGIKSLLKG